MRRIPVLSLALILLVVAVAPSRAQDVSSAAVKPVLTISFSGYDEVLQDVAHVGNLVENPQLAQMVEMPLSMATGGLAGLDKTRPWGVVVGIDPSKLAMIMVQPAQAVNGYVFLPVTDLDQLLEPLKPMLGEPTDAGDGTLKFDAQGQTVYVKENNGWAFLGMNAATLAAVPADPVGVLEGLNEQYDLAISLNVGNIPPEIRQMITSMTQLGIQMAQQQDGGGTLGAPNVAQAIEQITTALNELDKVTLGLAIDRSTSTAYFDYVITALPDTEMARQLAMMADATTDFAGFILPDAAVTLGASSKLSQTQITQMKATLEQARSNALAGLDAENLPPATLEQAKKLMDDLFAVGESAVDAGRLDGGMSVRLEPDAVTLVAGVRLGDTARLDAALRGLTDLVTKEDPHAAKLVQLDADQHAGVAMHKISLPTAMLASDVPQMPELVGDTMEVIVGVGPDTAYVAAGRDAAAALKQAIDQSKAQAGKSVPPMQMVIDATEVAEFVAAVGDDQAKGIATMIAGMLQQADGKDRLTITATLIPNGTRTRIELEEGLLKLLGSAPMMMGGP